MPGPFPGMDPYLEHPARWPGVHQGLITYTHEALNTLLPPGYVAEMGERLYITRSGSDIYPDVVVVKPPRIATLPTTNQSVATVTKESDPPWVLRVEPIEIREVFIEITAVEDASRVITHIEVLSPANKTMGSVGRRQYLNKQRRILQSETHLLEIDLLRRGAHTVAAPRVRLQEQGHWDYLICLHRWEQSGTFEVWPIPLRQHLPRIRIPLANGDPDVILDLQAVFDRCYDAGAYRRRLDYREAPSTPLTGDDTTWAETLLREQGLRK